MGSLAQTEWCSANAGRSLWGGLEAQGQGSRKAGCSNGNQSVANSPPFGFHGDRIGGGALAWLLQQMWPVQGWGVGGGGAWQGALGRGRSRAGRRALQP